MPKTLALLRYALLGHRRKGIALLDEMTPWRGVPEVAADLAGPALFDALAQGVQMSRTEAVERLRELADELEAAG